MPPRLLDVAERDGWTCWLCGGHVDPDAGETPWAPSVDHVVPKAHGGGNATANLRLAHRRCNTRRGSHLPELRWPTAFGVVHAAPLWEALRRAARRPGSVETVAVLTRPEHAAAAASWLTERASLLLGGTWVAHPRALRDGLAALDLHVRADAPTADDRVERGRRRGRRRGT